MADGVTQFDQSGDTDKDNLINEKSWEVSTEKGNTEERNHGEGKVEVAKGSAAHQVEPSIKSRDSDADKDTQQQEKQGREGGVHQPDQTSPNEVAIPISAPSQSDAVTVANHNGDDSVEQTESGNDDDDVKVEDEENNDRESIFIDRFGNILDMEEKEKTKKNKANEQKRKGKHLIP